MKLNMTSDLGLTHYALDLEFDSLFVITVISQGNEITLFKIVLYGVLV